MKHTITCLILTTAPVFAVTTFTEEFTSDNALWDGAVRGVPATHVSTGGADGGGYITNDVTFATNDVDDSVTVARGEVNLSAVPAPTIASGGAFVGDWISDNVATFSVNVRHTSPVPLNFFARFANPVNFPGAIAVVFGPPVLANTWTQLTFAINDSNPAFVSFEGSSFSSVFSNVGDIQIGVSAPAGLAGTPTSVTFDIDSAGIVAVPEPSTGLLGLLAGIGLLARRRRRN